MGRVGAASEQAKDPLPRSGGPQRCARPYPIRPPQRRPRLVVR